MVWFDNVSEKGLEVYLNEQLQLSDEIKVRVEEFNPWKVRLGVKIKPNINHLPTAFGGSINNIMAVCGWALVFNMIHRLDPEANLFVQKSSVEYIKPIKTDFTAECEMINKEKRDRFIKTYQRLGKARLEIKVLIKDEQETVARFRGLYVLFRKELQGSF